MGEGDVIISEELNMVALLNGSSFGHEKQECMHYTHSSEYYDNAALLTMSDM